MRKPLTPAQIEAAAVDHLRDPGTIRARCAAIRAHVAAGGSEFFAVDESRLPVAADTVVRVTRARYPSLTIPYHSRWRHFEAGGVDRNRALARRLAPFSDAEQARCRIDLAVVSVLLDAGAGADWRYVEASTGRAYTRSEGLGVATLHAFENGVFSSDVSRPMRVDGSALAVIDSTTLAEVFQARADNPLVGLEGRAEVLRRLGNAMLDQPDVFGDAARPGHLFDLLTLDGELGEVPAAAILRALLDHGSSIWLTPSRLGDVPLGDVWQHAAAREEQALHPGRDPSVCWVPFHKLSQWLTYSLFEPFEWAGVAVVGRDALTALPEYRNGGLLIDTGVLVPSEATLAGTWRAGDTPIVEWRALTVSLIDDLATLVRRALGRTPAEMPLACVLEGGTWAAGRALAQEARGGLPPLQVESDGTVF